MRTPRFPSLLLLLGASLTFATSAHAQRRARPLVGVGPFLTLDRGWNYDLNLGLTVGASYRLTSYLSTRAMATARVSAPDGDMVAIYPPSPISVRTGATIGAYLELHTAGWGPYLLVGGEYFVPRRQARAPSGSAAAAGGVGLAFGAQRQWRVESRYAVFERRLSATRGHLDVAWMYAFP